MCASLSSHNKVKASLGKFPILFFQVNAYEHDSFK